MTTIKRGGRHANYTNDTARGRQVNKAAAGRVWTLVTGLEGYRLGLTSLHLPSALRGAEEGDADEWDAALTSSINALRELRRELRKQRKEVDNADSNEDHEGVQAEAEGDGDTCGRHPDRPERPEGPDTGEGQATR